MDRMKKHDAFLQKLPVIPDVAAKVMGIAEEGRHISFKELENMIKIDPGLTAKILKVANSALYARQKEIRTLQMAITLLGFKNIKSLVMLTTASSMFRNGSSSSFYTTFWRHSVLTAFLAKEIIHRNFPKMSEDEGFLAGLLHDIGQVAMYHTDTGNYKKILEERETAGVRTKDLEEKYFGITHKEIGEQALAKWNFPQVYIDVAREHGLSNITSEDRDFILIISIADILSDTLTQGVVPAVKEGLLGKFANITNLPESELEYCKSEFVEKLTSDPLFEECQHLFHFAYSLQKEK